MSSRKRSAGLLLVSGERLLLLERALGCGNPLTWGLPGGQRDKNECAYSAALREAREEMGDVPDFEITGEILVKRGRKRYRVFVGRVPKAERKRWRPKLNREHRRHRWVDLGWCRRRRLKLHPVVRRLLVEHCHQVSLAI